MVGRSASSAPTREKPWDRRWAVGVAAGLATAALLVSFALQFLLGKVGPIRDGAFFAYLAECAARGFLPYRDLFSIHGFVHPGLGALFAGAAGSAGLLVFGSAISWLTTFTAVLASGAILGKEATKSRLISAGLIAWGMVSGWPFLGEFVASGSRPKFLAIVFLAGSVSSLASRRHVLGGALLAIAVLSWQPAAVVAVGISGGWALARGRPRGWGVDFFRVGCGTGVVLLLATGFLFLTGALSEFVAQAIVFPAEQPRRPHPGIWSRVLQVFGLLPLPVLVIGGAGIVFGGWIQARRRGARSSADERGRVTCFAISGWLFSYLLFLGFDLDSRGDLVPLLFPLGVSAASVFGAFGSESSPRFRCGAAVFGLVWLAGGDLLLPHHSEWIYKEPERISAEEVEEIVRRAGGRPVLIFADPLLQHAIGEDPPHPYVFWERGSIEWIQAREWGGLKGFLDRVFAEDFGAVVVGPRAHEIYPVLVQNLARGYDRDPRLTRREMPVWFKRTGSQ